jgi:hypothetical protein
MTLLRPLKHRYPNEVLHAICFKEDVYMYTILKQGMLFKELEPIYTSSILFGIFLHKAMSELERLGNNPQAVNSDINPYFPSTGLMASIKILLSFTIDILWRMSISPYFITVLNINGIKGFCF